MCELTLAIRRRMLGSYGACENSAPGLIDHLCMSAAEGAVEGLVRCGLSDGRFREASVADEVTCAAFRPTHEQENELAHVFFDLEVIQHEELPNSLELFHPPGHLRAACEQLVKRDDLVTVDGGFAWPLEQLTVFRRGFLYQGSTPP